MAVAGWPSRAAVIKLRQSARRPVTAGPRV